MVGQRFERLIVLCEVVDKKPRKGVFWSCNCDCGNNVEVIGSSLKSGKKKSCGCYTKDLITENAFGELIGKRFNKLLVLDTIIGKDNKTALLCQCVCGKKTKATSHSLKSGKKKSCGCIKGDRNKGFGYSGLTSKINSYKNNANKRKLSFELTREEFLYVVIQNCVYCGQIPLQISKGASKNQKKGVGDFISNGIDRVDNSVGYTLDNCVPCCKICNRAKGTMTSKEFNDHLIKIKNHILKNNLFIK